MQPLNNASKLVIPPLVRALTTSNAAAGSAVAVAPKPVTGGGLASLLGFGSSRVTTPLSEPLPGVAPAPRGSVSTQPAKLEVSALSEGVKVASLTAPSPVATVALLLGGGSSAETAATIGAGKVLAAMAFKATKDRTTFRVTRELEKIGTGHVAVTREGIYFAIDTVSIHANEATELLVDTVLNAKLQYHEVRDALPIARALAASSPAAVLEDVLHRVAYDGPLGQPTLPDAAVLEDFSHETVRQYHASLLQPNNILLASYGIDQGQLKGVAQPLFSAAHLEGGSGASVAASKYVGGTSSVVATSPATHAALAFEVRGGLSDGKAAASAAVAKALLDETRALPHAANSEGVSDVSAFSHLYKATGLVGVSALAPHAQSSQLVDALVKKVEAAANSVSEQQLRVAKQVALSTYKHTLSLGSTALPVIAAQLLAKGSTDMAQFASHIESITAQQLSAFIKEGVKSSPTIVTYGSLARLPRLDSVAKRLA